jgi:hypothetical protein
MNSTAQNISRTPEPIALPETTKGLGPRDLVIAPEEKLEFFVLQAEHRRQLKPDNIIEETLFELIIAAVWNLRRIRQLQTALQVSIDPLEALEDENLQKKLDRLTRHETRLERSYHKALKELKALQTERHNRSVMTPAYPAEISPLVNSIEISKRTQDYQKAYRQAVGGCSLSYVPEPRPVIFQNEPKHAPNREEKGRLDL